MSGGKVRVKEGRMANRSQVGESSERKANGTRDHRADERERGKEGGVSCTTGDRLESVVDDILPAGQTTLETGLKGES